MSEPRWPPVGRWVLGWTGEYWEIVYWDGRAWETGDDVVDMPMPDPKTVIKVPG
jgi:hypothetical protein